MKCNVANSLRIRIIIFLVFASNEALSYEVSEVDWKYSDHPMGSDFVICLEGAPDGALKRIKLSKQMEL